MRDRTSCFDVRLDQPALRKLGVAGWWLLLGTRDDIGVIIG